MDNSNGNEDVAAPRRVWEYWVKCESAEDDSPEVRLEVSGGEDPATADPGVVLGQDEHEALVELGDAWLYDELKETEPGDDEPIGVEVLYSALDDGAWQAAVCLRYRCLSPQEHEHLWEREERQVAEHTVMQALGSDFDPNTYLGDPVDWFRYWWTSRS